MQLKDNLFAGFPHLYYYSNPKLPERFLRACLDFRKLREAANRLDF
jgi:cobyrinic acid a,c-diamide synthase